MHEVSPPPFNASTGLKHTKHPCLVIHLVLMISSRIPKLGRVNCFLALEVSPTGSLSPSGLLSRTGAKTASLSFLSLAYHAQLYACQGWEQKIPLNVECPQGHINVANCQVGNSYHLWRLLVLSTAVLDTCYSGPALDGGGRLGHAGGEKPRGVLGLGMVSCRLPLQLEFPLCRTELST